MTWENGHELWKGPEPISESGPKVMSPDRQGEGSGLRRRWGVPSFEGKLGLEPTSFRLPYKQEPKVSPQLGPPGPSWQQAMGHHGKPALFPKRTRAEPTPPDVPANPLPCLNVWGSNSKVGWPECDHRAVSSWNGYALPAYGS